METAITPLPAVWSATGSASVSGHAIEHSHGLPDQNGLNLLISIQQPVQSPEPDIPCADLFSRCCIVRESCRHYPFVLWTLLFVADPLRSGYWRSLARTVSTGTASGTQTKSSTCSFALPYSSRMFASAHCRTMSSGQMPQATSPTCAVRRKNMHNRDWPMPPPIVCGNSPASNIRWNGSSVRC